jgi:hypothetical protein
MTTKSGFFALAQSRAADLPYAAWSLAPALEEKAADSPLDVDQDEEGCVHYILRTPRVECVKIQVRGAVCQLLAPPIPGLHRRFLGVGELLFALRDAGLNLMPLDGDAREQGVKSAALEAKVHGDVARVAGAFDLKSSRWNAQVGKDRAAFQVRETSVYTGGNVETFDYSMALVEADIESLSHRLAPVVGSLSAPGIKCALVQQSEELPPPLPPVENLPAADVEKKEAVVSEAVPAAAVAEGEEGAEEAAQPEAEGAKDGAEEAKDGAEGAKDGAEAGADKGGGKGDAVAAAEPAREPFNEVRVLGGRSHVYLASALRFASSAEAMERVDRTPLQLIKTVEQLFNLTRPIAFS